MNSALQNLDIASLRSLLAQETRKFLQGIEHGSPVSDLEEIRMTIREITAMLEKKEKNNSRNNQAAA